MYACMLLQRNDLCITKMCVYGMNNQFISKANYGMQIKCPNFPLYEMLDQHRLGHCLNDFDNLIKLAS